MGGFRWYFITLTSILNQVTSHSVTVLGHLPYPHLYHCVSIAWTVYMPFSVSAPLDTADLDLTASYHSIAMKVKRQKQYVTLREPCKNVISFLFQCNVSCLQYMAYSSWQCLSVLGLFAPTVTAPL